MENQTINCSVSSCRHHNAQNRCELRSINVCANCNCHSGKSDESMCGSYECGCKYRKRRRDAVPNPGRSLRFLHFPLLYRCAVQAK